MIEAVVFWTLSPIAILGVAGMLLLRKAVHIALCLSLVMVCLAVFYLNMGAEFLGVVQIVVYAGAIMMLFLFVLMLIGIDSTESSAETLRGQRTASILASLGFGLLLVTGAGFGSLRATGRRPPGDDRQISGLAELIFGRYVWAFEVTSVLLITAAIGAMLLAHHDSRNPRLTQRELAERRLRSLALGGRVGPLPPPGVLAERNAADVPVRLAGSRAGASGAER